MTGLPSRHVRPVVVYVLVVVLGVAAFLYPFWLPAGSGGDAATGRAHAVDAPLIAAALCALVVAVLALEVRQGTMNGATVALLAILSALAALLRLFDLPAGANAVFVVIVLGGAAFGPRFGLLLGLLSMVTGAILTGGLGPWLPFQMLALGWVGAGAGALGRVTVRMAPLVEIVVLAVYGWACGFLFGAVMNLYFWPFVVGAGPLAWNPDLSAGEAVQHYWSFYVTTSLAWDAARAVVNLVLILVLGRVLLASLRRFAGRCEPAVDVVPSSPLAEASPR